MTGALRYGRVGAVWAGVGGRGGGVTACLWEVVNAPKVTVAARRVVA